METVLAVDSVILKVFQMVALLVELKESLLDGTKVDTLDDWMAFVKDRPLVGSLGS